MFNSIAFNHKNLIDVECDCFRYKQKLTNLVYGNMEPDLMVILKTIVFGQS